MPTNGLGICPGCDAQPCLCSYRKNPNWVKDILAELDAMPSPALLATYPRPLPVAV